jgi:transposase InsO family protein
MQIKELSTAEIIELVAQLDQVKEFVTTQSNSARAYSNPANEEPHEMHHSEQRGASARTNTTRVVQRGCRYCGRTHAPGKCPAYGKTCTKCSKPNHFASVCRSSSAIHAVLDASPIAEPMQHDSAILHLGTTTDQIHAMEEAKEQIIIDGVSIPMQMDTGAAVSVLSSEIWERLNRPKLLRCQRRLQAYDGHELRVLGRLSTAIEYRGRLHPADLTVVHASKPFGLLGRDLMHADQVFSTSTDESGTAPSCLPAIKGVKATMCLVDGARPKFCRARPVPIAMEAAVNAELEKLQALGVIEPVDGPVSNASPVVWVKKKDGSLRMCADYSVHVNAQIKSDAYPIPNVECLFAKLKNAKKFASVDLRSAYWQIELDEAAQDLSTINTSKGLFRVKRLQMGMKNASFIFQRTMENILHDIKGVLIYQDDVLVFAENSSALNKRLQAVKTRLHEKNVTINEDKCIEETDEISFLGFRVSAAGIQPDDRLVQKILKIAPPSNRKELEHFLGLVNFFGRLIPNFAGKTKSLHNLRRAETPFIWSAECEAAFVSLKKEIASAPVVQPYSLDKELSLTTDASLGALAGVVTQNGHPVIFISRCLTSAEKNYSNIEREALAIFWAVHRLKHYFLGRKFTVYTDHQPLVKLLGQSHGVPTNTSARISRWALSMMHFDYDIMYTPGSKIPHADALSRLRFTDSSSDSSETSEAINCVTFETPVVSQHRIRAELDADPLIQSVLNRVRSGNWTGCSQAEKPFANVSSSLTIEQGMLFHKRCIFIPLRLRAEAFRTAHTIHSGYISAYNYMALSCWWPGMRSDIERFVRDCPICNRLRPRLAHERHKWPSAEYSFQKVHMDWAFVQRAGNVLIIVDAYSGWIEAFPCKDRSTASVISSLRTVFTRFGTPELLVSDNAPEFMSDQLRFWLQANGIRKMESPTYYPQANGAAERAVQTVKRALRAWDERIIHADFVPFLQRVLLHHRVSSQARGKSPAELVFGRKIRVPVVSPFQQGESVLYQKTKSELPSRTEYLMHQGHNTAWIFDGDALRLASTNQLAPDPVQDGEEVADTEMQADPIDQDPEPIEQPRRTNRLRRAPERFVP